MTRLTKLACAALMALALAGGVSTPTMAMPDNCRRYPEECDDPPPPPPLQGDPSQWGIEAKSGSFDITGVGELAAAGDSGAGKGGDIPVTPG